MVSETIFLVQPPGSEPHEFAVPAIAFHCEIIEVVSRQVSQTSVCHPHPADAGVALVVKGIQDLDLFGHSDALEDLFFGKRVEIAAKRLRFKDAAH